MEQVLPLSPTVRRPPISNGRLGMMLLIGTETVLFTCFIGAYLVLRLSATAWPPIGAPALTIGLSAVNTALLVVSSVLIRLTASRKRAARGLAAVLALGGLFVLLQAVEFHRLYLRGLTLQTGTYGALFYSLITCHGLHVLGGLIILAYTWKKVSTSSPLVGEETGGGAHPHPNLPPSRGKEIAERLGQAEMYWHFVTGVWLILFGILYIL